MKVGKREERVDNNRKNKEEGLKKRGTMKEERLFIKRGIIRRKHLFVKRGIIRRKYLFVKREKKIERKGSVDQRCNKKIMIKRKNYEKQANKQRTKNNTADVKFVTYVDYLN